MSELDSSALEPGGGREYDYTVVTLFGFNYLSFAKSVDSGEWWMTYSQGSWQSRPSDTIFQFLSVENSFKYKVQGLLGGSFG